MNVREETEKIENETLAEKATRSSKSRGRLKEEGLCPIRTVFARDRDRIIHCKSFRRLKYKTQVFLSPEGDHYRTRLTHTLEVSQIARTISRALRLNEDLTEAIALGHDLGHTPFGHAGEAALNDVSSSGFRHYEQSLRVVDKLEKDGKGLNLTFEVRNGIERHTCGEQPATLEGRVVRLSDRIAYINHDIDDAIRAGVLSPAEIPFKDILGGTHSERINTLITDTVESSRSLEQIRMSGKIAEAFDKLHSFMFESVYKNPLAKAEEVKAKHLIRELFYYFMENSGSLGDDFQADMSEDGKEKAVCDYIAGMTDRYAIQVYTDLFVPKTWNR